MTVQRYEYSNGCLDKQDDGELVQFEDYERLVVILRAVQADAGNWLHSDLLRRIADEVGQ